MREQNCPAKTSSACLRSTKTCMPDPIKPLEAASSVRSALIHFAELLPKIIGNAMTINDVRSHCLRPRDNELLTPRIF